MRLVNIRPLKSSNISLEEMNETIQSTSHQLELDEIGCRSKMQTLAIIPSDVEISTEARGALSHIGGNIADNYKLLFAWWDGHGKKITSLKDRARTLRTKINDSDGNKPIKSTGISILGSKMDGVKSIKDVLAVFTKDSELTKSTLTPACALSDEFTHKLTAHIFEKDNDKKWGYDEAVDGSVDIIQQYGKRLSKLASNKAVGDGYDANDLHVEEGALFGPLLLGDYAVSSSWNYALDKMSDYSTSAEKINSAVVLAMHDLVGLPKQRPNISLQGVADKASLNALLKLVDIYLESTDVAARGIKTNALPIFKTRMMSNFFGGNIGGAIKISASANYRALYSLMMLSSGWAAKLPRKAANRNEYIAEKLLDFIDANC